MDLKVISRGKTKEEIVEELLLAEYDRYYRLAYSYVHNEYDAGDIVQNGAYKAIKNSKSLKQEEYAATWLYRVMLNEIFTFCRQKNKENEERLTGEDEMAADRLAEGKTEDSYEELDLKRALEMLSDKDRAVVELKYFEDRKLNEIADILEENVNTVKSRLYRSLRRLRLNLEDDWMFSENQEKGR